MKKIKNIALIGMIAVGVLCSSCSEDFLKPDPLSFYEPEQTFTTEAGLRSVVATLDRHLRNYWTYYQAANLVTPFYTLFMHTDLAVAGKTDQSTIWADPSERLTPSDGMGGGGSEVNQFSYFWGETYTGIKSANTITSYIGKIKDMDEASRNKYIGWAYFHRAYRYLSLVFMFKDVPLVTKIIEGPKFDYKTTSREAILAKMVEDMEFAVQWVPEQKDMKEIGLVNKGACRMLLSKLYLATGQWEKAIQQLNEVIDNSGYSLMTNTFGTFVTPFNTETWPIQRNVIWDLHRPVNKADASNKETIMLMVNRYDNSESRLNTNYLYNMTPFWSQTDVNRGILVPSKSQSGMTRQSATAGMLAQYPDFLDCRAIYGRGEAFSRPTYHAEKSMWGDKNDLRHSREAGNWFVMEDLKYNDPKLLGTDDAVYYLKPIQKYADDGTLLCKDTIRCWFDYPYYKLWVEDTAREVANGYSGTDYVGGSGDWYVYRLAEAYLLRAEAYYWKKEYAKAAADVNKIRERAGCTDLFDAGELNGLDGLDVIMDERARELMYEEFRHVELVRVSFIKENQEGNYTSPKDLADESSNSYWWHRITEYNNYYNKGVKTLHNDEYKIGKYNIFWPIPQTAIDANLYGRVNQNYGYSGYELNETPIASQEEQIASGQ